MEAQNSLQTYQRARDHADSCLREAEDLGLGEGSLNAALLHNIRRENKYETFLGSDPQKLVLEH
jgi:hypothetical protein